MRSFVELTVVSLATVFLAICRNASAVQLQPQGLHLDVDAVADTNSDAFKALQSGVASLEQNLAKRHQEAVQEIGHRKTEYEQRLRKQRAQNQAVQTQTDTIRRDLKHLQHSVRELRGQALAFKTQNEALQFEMENLQRNISIAEEFLANSLALSKDKLNSSVLDILDELDAEDNSAARDKELDTFTSILKKHPHVSLLRIRGHIKSAPDDGEAPEDLLQRLRSDIESSVAQRNHSIEALQQRFEDVFSQGENLHTLLLQDQADLNKTVMETGDVKERLVDAVSHLKETRDILVERINALREYGRQRIGAKGDLHLDDVALNQRAAQVQTMDGETAVHAIVPNHPAALKKTVKAKGGYEMLQAGSDGCPPGHEITSKVECEHAASIFGSPSGRTSNSPKQNVPRWCSLKGGNCLESHCVHFNAASKGQGRPDLAPICRKGADSDADADNKASKAGVVAGGVAAPPLSREDEESGGPAGHTPRRTHHGQKTSKTSNHSEQSEAALSDATTGDDATEELPAVPASSAGDAAHKWVSDKLSWLTDKVKEIKKT